MVTQPRGDVRTTDAAASSSRSPLLGLSWVRTPRRAMRHTALAALPWTADDALRYLLIRAAVQGTVAVVESQLEQWRRPFYRQWLLGYGIRTIHEAEGRCHFHGAFLGGVPRGWLMEEGSRGNVMVASTVSAAAGLDAPRTNAGAALPPAREALRRWMLREERAQGKHKKSSARGGGMRSGGGDDSDDENGITEFDIRSPLVTIPLWTLGGPRQEAEEITRESRRPSPSRRGGDGRDDVGIAVAWNHRLARRQRRHQQEHDESTATATHGVVGVVPCAWGHDKCLSTGYHLDFDGLTELASRYRSAVLALPAAPTSTTETGGKRQSVAAGSAGAAEGAKKTEESATTTARRWFDTSLPPCVTLTRRYLRKKDDVAHLLHSVAQGVPAAVLHPLFALTAASYVVIVGEAVDQLKRHFAKEKKKGRSAGPSTAGAAGASGDDHDDGDGAPPAVNVNETGEKLRGMLMRLDLIHKETGILLIPCALYAEARALQKRSNTPIWAVLPALQGIAPWRLCLLAAIAPMITSVGDKLLQFGSGAFMGGPSYEVNFSNLAVATVQRLMHRSASSSDVADTVVTRCTNHSNSFVVASLRRVATSSLPCLTKKVAAIVGRALPNHWRWLLLFTAAVSMFRVSADRAISILTQSTELPLSTAACTRTAYAMATTDYAALQQKGGFSSEYGNAMWSADSAVSVFSTWKELVGSYATRASIIARVLTHQPLVGLLPALAERAIGLVDDTRMRIAIMMHVVGGQLQIRAAMQKGGTTRRRAPTTGGGAAQGGSGEVGAAQMISPSPAMEGSFIEEEDGLSECVTLSGTECPTAGIALLLAAAAQGPLLPPPPRGNAPHRRWMLPALGAVAVSRTIRWPCSCPAQAALFDAALRYWNHRCERSPHAQRAGEAPLGSHDMEPPTTCQTPASPNSFVEPTSIRFSSRQYASELQPEYAQWAYAEMGSLTATATPDDQRPAAAAAKSPRPGAPYALSPSFMAHIEYWQLGSMGPFMELRAAGIETTAFESLRVTRLVEKIISELSYRVSRLVTDSASMWLTECLPWMAHTTHALCHGRRDAARPRQLTRDIRDVNGDDDEQETRWRRSNEGPLPPQPQPNPVELRTAVERAREVIGMVSPATGMYDQPASRLSQAVCLMRRDIYRNDDSGSAEAMSGVAAIAAVAAYPHTIDRPGLTIAQSAEPTNDLTSEGPAAPTTIPSCLSAPSQWESCSFEFSHVTFSYPRDPDRLILDDFCLTIAAGRFIGIVGASGCGKSTLFMLLMRIYEPTKGTIFVNGYDIRDLPPRWLRRRFAYVAQSTSVLFDGSVGENVGLGDLGGFDDPVRQTRALRDALAWPFLARRVHDHHHDQEGGVAEVVAEVVAEDGAELVAEDGAELVAEDGAELVAEDGDAEPTEGGVSRIDLHNEHSNAERPSAQPTGPPAVDDHSLKSRVRNLERGTASTAAELMHAHGKTRAVLDIAAAANGETQFSGGEVQRLALARALMRTGNAGQAKTATSGRHSAASAKSGCCAILLDEATSALDAMTERRVQDALHHLATAAPRDSLGDGGGPMAAAEDPPPRPTSIVIAHRLFTLKRADHIVVMKRGKIVEQGTFQSLAADPSTLFSAMVNEQEVGRGKKATVSLAAVGDDEQRVDAAAAAGSNMGSPENTLSTDAQGDSSSGGFSRQLTAVDHESASRPTVTGPAMPAVRRDEQNHTVMELLDQLRDSVEVCVASQAVDGEAADNVPDMQALLTKIRRLQALVRPR